MNTTVKNLRLKDYNPCGDLTGRERKLCDEATKNFFNLPFYEVMRAVSIKAIADLEDEKNFRNVDALKNWADYNFSEVERRANLNFDSFTRLQKGLCKYLVHVLYENRYNIHYNALINYCGTLDEKIFPAAQEATHYSNVNTLIDELWKFLSA